MTGERAGTSDGSAAAPAPQREWLGRPRPSLKPIGTSYTRFVGWMKVVLPVIAGILVLMVVIWPQFREDPRGFRLGPSKITIEDVGGQKLINARYTGTDSKEQPYTVTAEALTQDAGEGALVNLTNPKADVSLARGSWLALAAPTGEYDRERRIVSLAGGVDLFHDDGYEFHTESATLNFDEGRVFGNRPVNGQGPLGEIQSAGFRILGNGKRILFTGKSRLVLYPAAKEDR